MSANAVFSYHIRPDTTMDLHQQPPIGDNATGVHVLVIEEADHSATINLFFHAGEDLERVRDAIDAHLTASDGAA